MKTIPQHRTANFYQFPLQPTPLAVTVTLHLLVLLMVVPSSTLVPPSRTAQDGRPPNYRLAGPPSTRTLNEPDNDKCSSDIQSLVNNASSENIDKLSISIPSLPLLPSVDQSRALNTEPYHPNKPSSLVDLKFSVLKRGHVSAPPQLPSPTL